MKLELKHLAAYLPYELNVSYEKKTLLGKLVNDKISTIGTIDCTKYLAWTYDGKFLSQFDIVGKGFNMDEIKPILRPLSDLTKEVEIRGKVFVPIIKIGFENKKDIANFLIFTIKNLHVPYCEMQKLLEWHFDIFGLIESNLAIDINTLNQ